jgi:hypothetical protein
VSIVDRALKLRPELRWESADVMQRALLEASSHLGIQPRSHEALEQLVAQATSGIESPDPSWPRANGSAAANEAADGHLGAALAAVQQGAWSDALRLAGSVIVEDPMNREALEIISTARKAIESTREGSGEWRQLTILFIEVVGSTALLGRLGAESYRDLILEVHAAAAKAVGGFGGNRPAPR